VPASPPGAPAVPATLTANVAIVNDVLELQLCADRLRAHADSGTYNGDVLLVGGGLSSSVDVPVRITLADTRTKTLLPLFFTVVVIIGSSYAWLLDAKIAATEIIFDAAAFRKYLGWWGTANGFVSIVFGLVAAAGVFNAQYLASDTWGSTGWQYVTIGGSMIGAFVAAATVTRVPGGA